MFHLLFLLSLASLIFNSFARFVAKSIIINSIVNFAIKSIANFATRFIANSSIFDSLIRSLDTKIAFIKNFIYIIFIIINEDKKKNKKENKKIINKKEKKRDKEKKDIRKVRVNRD